MLQSGCLIYLNTLDISMEEVFHAEDKERLRAKGGRVPAFVAELLDFFGGTYEDTVRFAGCPVRGHADR